MRKLSLYAIVFGVFSILTLSIFVLIYLSSSLDKDALLKTAIEEKTRLAGTVNEVVASPRFYYEMIKAPSLEKLLIAEMAKFQDVRYIRVVESNGDIYQSSLGDEWGKNIKDSDIKKAIDTKTTVIKDEIFGGEKIKVVIYPGYEEKTVWVGFSLKEIEEEAKGMFTRDVLVALISLLFILVFIFLILRIIIAPLKKMTLACEEVRKGNLDVRVNIKSTTEIGELARTFNEMTKDLKESQGELKEAKNILEIKVEARTKELREVAESLDVKVKEKTKELQEKVTELERFKNLAVGRELKMVELKKEIKELEGGKRQPKQL